MSAAVATNPPEAWSAETPLNGGHAETISDKHAPSDQTMRTIAPREGAPVYDGNDEHAHLETVKIPTKFWLVTAGILVNPDDRPQDGTSSFIEFAKAVKSDVLSSIDT